MKFGFVFIVKDYDKVIFDQFVSEMNTNYVQKIYYELLLQVIDKRAPMSLVEIESKFIECFTSIFDSFSFSSGLMYYILLKLLEYNFIELKPINKSEV